MKFNEARTGRGPSLAKPRSKAPKTTDQGGRDGPRLRLSGDTVTLYQSPLGLSAERRSMRLLNKRASRGS